MQKGLLVSSERRVVVWRGLEFQNSGKGLSTNADKLERKSIETKVYQ